VRKPAAALASLAFFALAPGLVAGYVPWYLTDRWTRNHAPASSLLVAAGASVVVAGAVALVGTFALYVIEGKGTPAPVAPTEQLVVRGLNRYVRNPMYLAVVSVIVGQAIILAQPALFAYAAVAFAAMAAFARWYEEPHLRARYGAQYDAYCRHVPAWLPHLPHRR
jgi:protein-S-isoprenylcysteine O-methyltransferase Ste14